MIQVVYTSESGKSITRQYQASEFPFEAIISLVEIGITVTINSVPTLTITTEPLPDTVLIH